MLTQQEYLEKHGVVCPNCGSNSIGGKFVETNDGGATQQMSCDDCDFHWQDNYKLEGFEPA